MSALTQFFGGGGGIPSEVLVVNGGSGASRAYVISINPYAPSTRCSILQGQGGYVASAFLDITPGSTCPVTVGYGGTSVCRSAGSPTPWCFFNCCVGGSGTASRFSTLGGTDRTQVTSPTDASIAAPYGINLLATYGCPFSTGVISSNSPCLLNAASETSYGFLGYGGPVCSNMCGATMVMTAYQGGACMQFKTFTASPCMSANGLDSHAAQGFVSKITGTVQAYGSSKAYNWGYCAGPYGSGFTPVSIFHLCKTRPHPSHLGTGSGHGAWMCEGSVIDACPGTVIIQYPSDFNAASVSSPNVCDCSPATPGFRTYRFLCPGSITFP